MTVEATRSRERSLLQNLMDWARRSKLERRLAVVLVVLGLIAGTATFGVMTGDLPITAEPQTVLLLLITDLIVLLGLSALIARRLALLWIQRKQGLAGAHLHGRLVALFSVVAVTPTVLVAIFSVMLFDFGLKTWFSNRVSTAIHNSLAVAEAYTEEHLRTIGNDALAISQAINRRGVTLIYNPLLLSQMLTQQSELRSLTEAAVYDGSGYLLARATNFLLAFNPEIPDWAFDEAKKGQISILKSDSEDRVRALVRLDMPNDTFLYIGRLVDARVLGHLDRTRGAVQLYSELEGRRYGMEITFALIFAVVALMLLLAAIWIGLTIADHLTVPIGNLIAAAGQVAKGDLSARVDDVEGADEIGTLSSAFNSMTSNLESQQSELLAANRRVDDRNQFIEAVLGGVSAGVIGLDSEGWITLPNRAACELLEASPDQLKDKHLADFMPDIAGLLEAARRRPNRLLERSVNFQRIDGSASILLVRVTVELDERGIFGFVVTFDDMTELQAAQRKAAWSDIARRIAHEIKNPLTPIQLSAERLRRKYLKQIVDEPETFQTCTDTIIRHVEDIGRMVNEFSSFARMPIPIMAEENLLELIDGALFLQRSAEPGIRYDRDYPEGPVRVSCDSRQIGRALTNLLLNAAEAIQKRLSQEDGKGTAGQITLKVDETESGVVVEVHDNGCGLPKTERHRLTEPYVTTRERGTGLGLAIVKKIMEEHNGDLILHQNPEGGAVVSLRFPRSSVGLQRRDLPAKDTAVGNLVKQ